MKSLFTKQDLEERGPCGIVADANGYYIALFKDRREAEHYAYKVWADEGCAAGTVDEHGNVSFD